MLKLIKIELYKLLHKKSIYIILILMTIFCFLNNYLYWKDYDNDGFYIYEDTTNIQKELNNTIKELKKLNYHNEKELLTYINTKTQYDILTLKKEYNQNTWQYKKINDYLYDITYKKNYNTYKNITDNETITIYNESIKNLKNNNWQYFINLKKEEKETELKELLKSKNNTSDNYILKEINTKINNINLELEIIEYRLKNNISESKSYLDTAINKYKEYKNSITNYKEKKNLTNKEQITYNKIVLEYNINKYIMDNKININKENTINYQLRDILTDYELFFIILIIVISSSIMYEEFTTGTIKLLLIKPYSRCKILIGKYLTCLVVLLISIIYIILIQLLIGNIFFDIKDLNIPVVIYHYSLKKIIEYSLVKYMLIKIIYKLPLFIILLTISYSISIILNSNTIAFIISILLYMTSSLINNLAITYNIKWMKYLLTINWNISDYIFGNIKELENTNLKDSLIIIGIYYIIIMIITITNFNKKNIKNT